MLSFLAPFLISTLSVTGNIAPETEPTVPAPIVQEEIVEEEETMESLEETFVCEKCPKRRVLKDQA